VTREERRLVEHIQSGAQALLDARTKGQEHAARYMFQVSLEQLYRWAEEQAAKSKVQVRDRG
jgi:hypothetical protein